MRLFTQRVTEADLTWWLKLAPTLDWIWAKTYASFAPHHYVVNGRTLGMTDADFMRAGAVIRTFGEPGKFYKDTNIYLTSPDGSTKWWTMDPRVADTDLVNMATTERSYGVQDAPRTVSGIRSDYDEIAPEYDRLHDPVTSAQRRALVRSLAGRFGPRLRTLDIGCGTGAALDWGFTTWRNYTGVDPSQGMLNEFVIKRGGKVGRLIPKRFEDALAELQGERFDLVLALGPAATLVEPWALEAARELCDGVMVVDSMRAVGAGAVGILPTASCKGEHG